MRNQYLLGIDVGTTTVKAVILDSQAHTVATVSKEYKTEFPQVGWAEQNPEDWWRCICEILPRAYAQCRIEGNEIVGVSVSCQSPTLIPMDKDGNVLYPAIIWMDRRSDAECEMLRREIGEEEIFSITGDLIDPYYLLSESIWFKNHRPELYEKTEVFLQANGYINYKLTGNFNADDVNASLSGLFDYRLGGWSDAILSHPAVRLEKYKFPTPVPAEAVVGSVSKIASRETGLKPGIPVVAGTVDSAGAAVECGVIRPGMACEMTGTSSVLLTVSDQPHISRGLTYMRHQVAGQHITLGAMSSTGGAYKWCRDEICGAKGVEDAYDRMNLCIEKESPQPSGLIFLPYMNGERAPIWSTEAKGTWLGIRMSTTHGQLLRSVLEGTAFALRHNMDVMRQDGCRIDSLGCSGGHTKSDLWLKIKASVIGLPVSVPEADSGAPWGAAILAGTACGMFESTEDILRRVYKLKKYVEPDREWQKIYEDQYGMYLDTYPAVESLNGRIHRLQQRIEQMDS